MDAQMFSPHARQRGSRRGNRFLTGWKYFDNIMAWRNWPTLGVARKFMGSPTVLTQNKPLTHGPTSSQNPNPLPTGKGPGNVPTDEGIANKKSPPVKWKSSNSGLEVCSQTVAEAYDIKKEKKLAAGRDYPAVEAVCWSRGREIGFSFMKVPPPPDAHLIVTAGWLEAEELLKTPITGNQARVPNYVRGLVFHAGDKWRVWNPKIVWGKLGENGDPSDELLVGYIGGSDLSYTPRSPTVHCRISALSFLERIAILYLQAKDEFPGFDSVFKDAETTRQAFSREVLLAVALHRARHAVFNLIRHVEEWLTIQPGEDAEDRKDRQSSGEYLNGARMLKEGFLIGSLIREAEALIFSPKWAKMIAKQGAPRNRPSAQFWEWICTNEKFKSLPASEIIKVLLKEPCPVYGGKLTENETGTLFRPDGKKLMTSGSFASQLPLKRDEWSKKRDILPQ